jgi:hypothetical protein
MCELLLICFFNQQVELDRPVVNWTQLFRPNRFYFKLTNVTAFIIDETTLQTIPDDVCLAIAVESIGKTIL